MIYKITERKCKDCKIIISYIPHTKRWSDCQIYILIMPWFLIKNDDFTETKKYEVM